jgi:hypothetical protein
LFEWEQADRGKLIAYLMESSSRCQTCGTSPWEWDEMTNNLNAPYLPVHTTCMGCQMLEQARTSNEELPAGTRVVLEPAEKAAVILAEKDRRMAQARR